MKAANEITEELKNMDSILADMSRAMPFTVPDGYFAQLVGNVNYTISAINELEHIPDWGKDMPHSVPAGYFNELPEEMAIAGMASSLPKTNAFSVPQGYFNALPAQLLQAAKAADTQTKATIIPLKRNNIFRQVRWAAAAILVTGLGFGAYQFYQGNQQTNTDNLLAAVPTNDLQDYVQGMYRIDVDRIEDNKNVSTIQVDNKDIIQYLDETGWD